jgi:glycosyltransferase involved in cell wall biosynthesis
MRIGVDATCWQNLRGYGRHARSLLGALFRVDRENRYILFADSSEHLETIPSRAEVKLVPSVRPASLAASANGHRSAHDLWKMGRAMSAPNFDLLLFPTIYSYVPVFSRAKKVVMIHDVIAETYPKLTLPNPAARFFWNAKATLGRWQADAIVTVSDYSRQGILKRFRLAREKVFVVGEASDPVFHVVDDPQPSLRLRSLGVTAENRSVIYVGGFGPHKNLEMLLEIFKELAEQKDFGDVRLIMVGEYKKEIFHSYYGILKTRVTELGIADRVIFTGYLTDDDLVVLLNIATVLVLPSLIEGFGLPAVEAAACGCPVIATTASPLSDLLGSGGVYVEPTKREDLKLALERVLGSEELRQQMHAAGLAAARRLTWEGAARQMIDIFNQVVAG